VVKEGKATGPTYRTTLRTVIRNSYAGHYRRMVPKLLAALEFRSNNERHRPVMQALELVKRFADTKLRTFPIGAPNHTSCRTRHAPMRITAVAGLSSDSGS
jgi:hypothetical protein